jgi:DNA-binding HxlR family transcriptional regulator
VLSSTLRKLEENGLVDRTVFAEVPLHVEYSLTPLGRSAAAPLAHLRDWVEENLGSQV